jgi:WD40 repeat protein
VGSAGTFECESTLIGHSDNVIGVCFSSDGFKVASCSNDRSVKIWNLITRECVSTLSGHSDYDRAVSWSPDGSMLASGSDDKTIKLWDAQSGKVNSTLSGHNDPVRSVCFTPCGTKIVGGGGGRGGDFSIRIWDAALWSTRWASTLSPSRTTC